MGMTSLVTLGLATAIPATALVTDTAGVNIPSAIVKLVPKRHYEICKSVNSQGEISSARWINPNEQRPFKRLLEFTPGR
jgi:hypothetical protein